VELIKDAKDERLKEIPDLCRLFRESLRHVLERLKELEETDAEWRIKATESFCNGVCPICFCPDGGPHEKGCEWYEMEYRIRILEKSSDLNANIAVSAIDRAAEKESRIFVLENAISEVCADEITEPKWAKGILLSALRAK
jgi:hypothetical protein